MFDIGFMELVVLGIVAMLVVGPDRLPETARAAGKMVGKAKRFFATIQTQIEQELRVDELNKLNKKIMDDTSGQSFSINTDAVMGQVLPSDAADKPTGAATGAAKNTPDTQQDKTQGVADQGPIDNPSKKTQGAASPIVTVKDDTQRL